MDKTREDLIKAYADFLHCGFMMDFFTPTSSRYQRYRQRRRKLQAEVRKSTGINAPFWAIAEELKLFVRRD